GRLGGTALVSFSRSGGIFRGERGIRRATERKRRNSAANLLESHLGGIRQEMKNLIILPHIRGKIEARVDRVLRDLDNPVPPLRLEDVRELLKLDLAYYTGEKDGFLAETIH